jgi:hypothetical protein
VNAFEKSYDDGSAVQVTTHDTQVVFAQTSQGTFGRGAALISPDDARALATELNTAADAAEAFKPEVTTTATPLPGEPGGAAAGVGDLVAQLGGVEGLKKLLAAVESNQPAAPRAADTPTAPYVVPDPHAKASTTRDPTGAAPYAPGNYPVNTGGTAPATAPTSTSTEPHSGGQG